MSEVWVNAVGFEGRYKVSDRGRVWSIRSQKILKSPPNRCGYPSVCLYDDRGVANVLTVHRIVLSAFVGLCPMFWVGMHLDNDKTNNRLGNLQWGTQEENIAQREREGRGAKHERSGRSKLNASQVQLIRYGLKHGKTQRWLGRTFGVNHKTIGAIVHGRTWAGVA